MRASYFLAVFLVPLSVIVGHYQQGWFSFLTPMLVFGLIPLLDLIVGDFVGNPDQGIEEQLSDELFYRMITWLCVPVQVGVVIWSTFFIALNELPAVELVGLIASVGVCSGILGINVAHELVHRVKSSFEPLLGQVLLSSCLYMHWGLEHVVGHHRTVATPEDPATARLNESFYRFLPRTIIGSFISALTFEDNRLRRQNRSPWSLKNRILLYTLIECAILLTIFLLRGDMALLFFVAQSFVAICLLEIVNYIEHYGLLRATINGQLETTKPWHSWNSSCLLTNLFLFNLQRHSDHHFKPARRYQILRHFEESPQLPTGYAGMIWLAAIPFLWKRIMNPRIEATQFNKQLSQ